MGLAGLKKDIERIRADTNKSVLELRGLLGKWDLGNFPELWGGGVVEPVQSTNPWEWFSVQSMCVVPSQPPLELSSAQPEHLYMAYHVHYSGSGATLTESYPVPRLYQGHLPWRLAPFSG